MRTLGLTLMCLLVISTPVIASEGTTIDFKPIADLLIPIIAAIIVALLTRLSKRMGLEMDRRTVLDAVEGMSRQIVAQHGPQVVDVGNQQVATVANYILSQTPDAAKRLGLTTTNSSGGTVPSPALTRLIETRLAGTSLHASAVISDT